MHVIITILQVIIKIVVGISFTIGIICLVQSFALFTTKQVDGTGIGIYFMGVEINDRVPLKDFPVYGYKFLWAGLSFMILPAIYYAVVKLKRPVAK